MMSQLFFLTERFDGIMITLRLVCEPEVNLNKSVSQVEFFDTGVALLAGVMIIPAVSCSPARTAWAQARA